LHNGMLDIKELCKARAEHLILQFESGSVKRLSTKSILSAPSRPCQFVVSQQWLIL